MNGTFVFSHPAEYRIVGVAGSGAYAVVCKADVIDPVFAEKIGIADFAMHREESAAALLAPSGSDMVMDATPMPDSVSPLQLVQRQASQAIYEQPAPADLGLLGGVSGSSGADYTPGSTEGEQAQQQQQQQQDQLQPSSHGAGSGYSSAASPLGYTHYKDQTRAGDGTTLAPGFGEVAIKQLIDHSSERRVCSTSFQKHYLRKVCREVEILHHFRGVPQIISLMDLYLSRNEEDIYMVMPYMGHNLRQIVEMYPLEEPLVRWIVCQVLLGLVAVHRAGVIHRDLTLANLLVDGTTWDVRIADFGLSRARETVDQDITLDVVTLPYRAPELLLEYKQYTSKIDIWSLGCIAAECFTRQPFLYIDPSKNPDPLKQLKLIFRTFAGFPNLDTVGNSASLRAENFLRSWHSQLGGQVPAPQDVGAVLRAKVPGISEEALDVVRAMLHPSPHERLSAEALLGMPWFQEDHDCRHLIGVWQQLPAPGGPFGGEAVEALSMDGMRQLLVERSQGRRADFDSRVTECRVAD
jgi:serine/threonine protein kinase